MSRVIGQVWREVVGCRNWPVMRVPLFIALRRNEYHRMISHTVARSWCCLQSRLADQIGHWGFQLIRTAGERSALGRGYIVAE